MPISEKDLAEARQAWGNGLVEISDVFEREVYKKLIYRE